MMADLKLFVFMILTVFRVHCKAFPEAHTRYTKDIEVEDALQVVTFGLGNENEDMEDSTKEYFSGATAYKMITAVRIEYYESAGVTYLRCIGFTYGDLENNCPEVVDDSNQVEDFILDDEEFITNITGDAFMSVSSIWFLTNKGREIGPFGPSTDPSNHQTKVSNHGAPLLYVDGLFGVFLYSYNFTFHVHDLEAVTNEVANQTYSAIKGPIEKLHLIRESHKRMLPDIARKGCYHYGHKQTEGSEIACDLERILDQVDILTTVGPAHLQNHAPRNLLNHMEYDGQMYEDDVAESIDFHVLINTVDFVRSFVVHINQDQSSAFTYFFSFTAESDQGIGEEALTSIQEELESKATGSTEITKQFEERFTNIFSVGISITAMEAIEQAFHFARVLSANLNPFRWIFGGLDVDAVEAALQALMQVIGDFTSLVDLIQLLDSFVDHAKSIIAKFAENQEAFDAMSKMVVVLRTESSTDVIQMHARAFLKSYGDYTPHVTSQDIIQVTTLLGRVGVEACNVMNDLQGELRCPLYEEVYAKAAHNCLYLSADIALLDGYFQDIYTLQFKILDTMASILKGEIAEAMTDRVNSIERTIDIRTVAIASAMVETTYQVASLARCNFVEYLAAGKRPDVCTTLLFGDDEIRDLLDYTGSEQLVERIEFAYLPTTQQENSDIPFIDIPKLLLGEFETLRLPMANKGWLKQYGWLPLTYSPESAFFVHAIEMYLPALKCNETGESTQTVHVQSLSKNPTNLYSEAAPPTYSIDHEILTFEYTEPIEVCAGDVLSFPVKDSATMDIMYNQDVCVVSHGIMDVDPVADYTFPSLFTSWTVQVTGSDDCTLVVDEDMLEFQPLITFKIQTIIVPAKESSDDTGIDECWPIGSRCPPEHACLDQELDYCCTDSAGTCNY